MEESRLPDADVPGCCVGVQHASSPGCSSLEQTCGEECALDFDWSAWPALDDFPGPQPPFAWDAHGPPGPSSREQQPPGDTPSDDLDLDTFLDGLDGFGDLGGDFGGAEPALGMAAEPLGSLDSLLPSDFHFGMGERDSSPPFSEADCLSSPPEVSGNWAEEMATPKAPPKKRKARTKPQRQIKVQQPQPKAPRRPRGRPRVYDTSIPEKGRDSAGESDSCSAEVVGKKRGAKPKYKFSTEAEAVAMRRERNRSTAISSYYKKKERDEQLLHAIECLQRERDALQQLEKFVECPCAGVDIGLLGETLRQTCSGQQTILQLHGEQAGPIADAPLGQLTFMHVDL